MFKLIIYNRKKEKTVLRYTNRNEAFNNGYKMALQPEIKSVLGLDPKDEVFFVYPC